VRGILAGEKSEEISLKWVADDEATFCGNCGANFSFTKRKVKKKKKRGENSVIIFQHHCRACGDLVCSNCSEQKIQLKFLSNSLERACDRCFQLYRNEQ
jgi:hypothetical protein